MGKSAVAIELTAPERRELESLARALRTGQAMARRARIVLAAAAGLENKAICAEVGADANTVSKWRRRFAAHRLDGLLDEPRPGTPRRIGDDQIAETIRLTLETAPQGATHWSLRSMAKVIHHADRGVQFAAQRYRARLLAHGMLCSMSRKGDCWDNAPMESFFATLKGELVEGADYQTRAQARADVFHYIEGFYNKRRLHSALGYITPEQKAAGFHSAASTA